jgi:hypothetical protein
VNDLGPVVYNKTIYRMKIDGLIRVEIAEEKMAMLRNIEATRLIDVACRQEDALAIIQEIKNIEKTEVKADEVQVFPSSERTGTYKVRGHFAGIPWRNEFRYVLNEQGFHSFEAHPPGSGSRIQGGFVAISTGEQSCSIIHYEQYILPRWGVLLKLLIVWYLQWSMKKELHDLQAILLKRAAEIAHP